MTSFTFILSVSMLFSICFTSQISLDDYLPTPGGFRHKTCVHYVPSSSFVKIQDGSEIHIFSHTNELMQVIPPCTYPTFKTSQLPKSNLTMLAEGWQVFTHYKADKLDNFTAHWTVPQSPIAKGRQILYSFIGLENYCGPCSHNVTDSDQIGDLDVIQPVLQWGKTSAGGGAYWSVASWYATEGGVALHSDAQQVKEGDLIYGQLTEQGPGSGKWLVQSSDVSGNFKSGFTIDKGSITKDEPFAFVSFEVFFVEDCKQYPDDHVAFTNINIHSRNSPVVPAWVTDSNQIVCDEHVVVNSPYDVSIYFK